MQCVCIILIASNHHTTTKRTIFEVEGKVHGRPSVHWQLHFNRTRAAAPTFG